MSHESDITYSELTSQLIDAEVADDINRLLSQLSARADRTDEEQLRTNLEHDTRMFVARHEKRIVGAVSLCSTYPPTGRKDWIEDVMVDGNYRRRGIAETLMQMAEVASRDGDAKSLRLTSHAGRTSARALYAKLGYEHVKTSVFRKVR